MGRETMESTDPVGPFGGPFHKDLLLLYFTVFPLLKEHDPFKKTGGERRRFWVSDENVYKD